ncbi:helix-turn-helix domain-containing protein [Liquorilactobacillus vini]|uniref:Helicase Helix-turn-helix domain-containing protein n=2 Tax=Liquorilactobacillus vini TaxID=238015 RepID=A0A0R2CED8_9LACO|nr:helix-turn-helix domain-containing protein [Liquorilactobacillus vini]KRM89701.1 hypothetical protein FD21_GL000748 [Liquorilactobacillus vini DSM 20605]
MLAKRWLYFFSIDQPRRPNVIRHVLANKKTVSNLFWGLSYQMLEWLGVAQIENIVFDQQLTALKQHGWLQQAGDQQFCLTPAGQQCLTAFLSEHYWRKAPQLVQYFQCDTWLQMLTLIVQTFSESSYQNQHYYVITTSPQIQFWFKKWIKHFDYQKLQTDLPRLLNEFLTTLPTQQADVFLNFFAGHQVAGQTYTQMAEQTNWSVTDLKILHEDLALRLAAFLRKQSEPWQVLVSLFQKSPLPASCVQTYQRFLNGESSQKIANERHLKLSTIREHLLMAAIFCQSFPYQQLLASRQLTIMKESLSGAPSTWNYQIVEPREIDFFSFRLYQIQQTKIRQQRKSTNG